MISPEKNIYTNKKFWDEYFERRHRNLSTIKDSPFSDIFDKYLAPDSNKKIVEIGCADSSFLCYLSKKFGYQAYGIDYSDAIERTADMFKFNGLSKPILYKENFFSWQPSLKFNIVCSFGFVEHFDDLSSVLKKHVELLISGGTLIITLPHFAHGQYLFHWLIDKENLKKHNTKIMNLSSLRKALGGLSVKIDYLSYYKTFGFWTERTSMAWWEKCIKWSILKLGKIITKIWGHDRPNPLFSPHIVLIATKLSL